MIERPLFLKKIKESFETTSVCAILGPRQCGKTTLAKEYSKALELVHFFDLENPEDLAALESPSLSLSKLEGLIVIDEIQRRPELFPYLRFLVDNTTKKFLILGSASQELIHQSTESLAGRISYIELTPFQFKEIDDIQVHWLRGGFPKSFLAKSSIQSEKWRINYIKTFLERDLAQMGIGVSSNNIRRLWAMLAHYHGQVANISELSRSLDITDKTIKRYMDILEGCFMIRQLQAWHENLAKRQVKRPKLYLRDSGLLHSLLGIVSDSIHQHPKCGASWEGYAMENIISSFDEDLWEFYFWATEKGAELDLLAVKGNQRIGFEFKYSDKPKITKSMHVALEDLKLTHLYLVTPGSRSHELNNKITLTNLKDRIQQVW